MWFVGFGWGLGGVCLDFDVCVCGVVLPCWACVDDVFGLLVRCLGLIWCVVDCCFVGLVGGFDFVALRVGWVWSIPCGMVVYCCLFRAWVVTCLMISCLLVGLICAAGFGGFGLVACW